MIEFLKNLLSKLGIFNVIRKIIVIPYYKYKSYMFYKYANTVFVKAIMSLNETKIDYWLDFGTLLGAIREKDFIKHDMDIDFGILLTEQTSELEKNFYKNGFKKEKEIFLKKKGIKIYESYKYMNKINVDVYYYEQEKDYLIYYELLREPQLSYGETIRLKGGLNVEMIKYPIFTSIEYEFKNIKCKIPSNYKEHLIISYGKDYMMPKKFYDIQENINRVKVMDELGILKKRFNIK